MVNYSIEIFDLTKIYNLKVKKEKIKALNKINMTIKDGEIFGLLGPNGAGKTTLIHILTTIKQPTNGYALIDGYHILKNPKKAKSRVALMLEDKMLYRRMTAYNNLKFFCKIYNISNYKEKINHMVTQFGLTKWLNQYVENFSSGMTAKLALCRTLLLERNILFLDEPTIGLDVNSVSFIADKLRNVRSTIVLASHNMRVVENLCDRIAFLNRGNIMKIGTPKDIKKLMQKEITIEILIMENKNNLKNELREKEFVTNIIEIKEGLKIQLKNREFYKELLQILGRYKILKVKEQDLMLEDLFNKLK